MESSFRGGYAGKVLRVNLSKGSVWTEPLDANMVKLFIGGKGLAAAMLYGELKPYIDPLSPENKLLFVTGPLTGASIRGTKVTVATKSPLTGTFLDSSVGGKVGPNLKFAGYDALVVEGRSDKLVYLWVDDEDVEFKDARHLQGKSTSETERSVKKEVGDLAVGVASIGIAGEKLVRFACVISDYWRAAGRGGSGAVMGSKNLKAVVVRGTKGLKLAEPKAYLEAMRNSINAIHTAPTISWRMSTGTTTAMAKYSEAGMLPTRNFQSGVFEGINEINDVAMRSKVVIADKGCYMCPTGHCNFSVVRSGRHAGVVSGGPQYETLALIGSNCGVSDIDAIVRANYLCNEYSLDTISTGGVIAFAMECYERGILTSSDVDGVDLRFGNAEAMATMVEKVARREGVGDLLAEGVLRASKKIGKGSEGFAIQVKGLEAPGYSPRASLGTSLGYATADRGACHLHGAILSDDEVAGFDRYNVEEPTRVKAIKSGQDMSAVVNSLGICAMGAGQTRYPDFMSTVVGRQLSGEEYAKIGERVCNLIRAFNVREGFSRKDDTLPRRVMEELMPDGPAKGFRVTEAALNRMLNEYYDLRGWSRDGYPMESKLQEMGLEFVIKDQRRVGKLG